jgi:ferredoxin
LLSFGRKGKGLPARAIPFEVFHVASLGIDTLLSAIAYGASQVSILITEKTASGYVDALKKQMRYAQTILTELGYAGVHFSVIENPAALWDLQAAGTVAKAATFNLSPEKRTSLDFALDHLFKNSSAKKETIGLPAGAPFGSLTVNKQTCTLCKACIGACPESALIDSQEAPALRFIERNCVQCGLCANTCPENAIALVPRLLMSEQAKQPVTLNEAEPFNCVRCGKPFGTRQMVDNMLAKLGSHSMFAGGLQRLQMCGDCRVVDMMENKAEASIHDYFKK